MYFMCGSKVRRHACRHQCRVDSDVRERQSAAPGFSWRARRSASTRNAYAACGCSGRPAMASCAAPAPMQARRGRALSNPLRSNTPRLSSVWNCDARRAGREPGPNPVLAREPGGQGCVPMAKNHPGRTNVRTSLQVAPVTGMIAPARCGWAPLWKENHSRSYGLSEEQGRACLDKRGPG